MIMGPLFRMLRVPGKATRVRRTGHGRPGTRYNRRISNRKNVAAGRAEQ
jgi:hypothetical protein